MQDKIDAFLEAVDEQIACRLCHAEINEELRGHIEDKAEDYRGYGLPEEEVLGRAIRDMGEPDVIGMELNRQHRVRTAWPLLGIIGILLVIGLTELVLPTESFSSLPDLIYSLSDGTCYIWGLALLLLVMYQGYPFLLKNAGMIVATMGSFCGVLAVGGFCQRLLAGYGSENMTLYRLYSSGFRADSGTWRPGVGGLAVSKTGGRLSGHRAPCPGAGLLSGCPPSVPGVPTRRILDSGAVPASDLSGNRTLHGGQRLVWRVCRKGHRGGYPWLCGTPDPLGRAGKPGVGALEPLHPSGGLRG